MEIYKTKEAGLIDFKVGNIYFFYQFFERHGLQGLQGLIYNGKVKLRRYNLKIIKNSVQYDAMITRENFNKKKVNVKNI